MARTRMIPQDVRIEPQSRLTARSMRAPNHNFQGVACKPFTLHLAAIAPVLPGDTIKASSLMARIVGDNEPENQVLGKWFETWQFYVRIGDLPNAATIRNVIVDPASAAAVDWDGECMEAITKGFFMDEEETYATVGQRLRFVGTDWADSVKTSASLPAVGGTDEWADQWTRYQSMRRAKLTVATFEEYLAMNGVEVPPQLRDETDVERKRPELLHYTREFAYPQPTVDPTDGTGKARVQWFIQAKQERARFAAEPGFICALFAVRSKTYRTYTVDPLDLLNSAEGWMPSAFDTDPHTSLIEVTGGIAATPLNVNSVVDVRDLYLHGHSRVIGTPSGAYAKTIDDRPTQVQIDAMPKFNIDGVFTPRIASRVSSDTTA